MAQRVKEMISEEIIDENVIKKQVHEAKKQLEKAESSDAPKEKSEVGVPTVSVGKVEEAKRELKEEIKEAKEEIEQEKKEKKVEKKSESKKPVKPAHGKKYFAVKAKIEKDKVYSIDEAIDKVLETSITKFDATIEVHAKLTVGSVRGTLVLPAGAPKQKKAVVVTDTSVDDIVAKIKANKLEFDILIATPSVMPKLAQVAKILGPKGLMPSPKSGTVVENTKETAEEFKSGKIEYKQDDQKNIHLGVAKISWGKEKIKENLAAIIKILPKNKVSVLYLASTMGPSVKVEVPK